MASPEVPRYTAAYLALVTSVLIGTRSWRPAGWKCGLLAGHAVPSHELGEESGHGCWAAADSASTLGLWTYNWTSYPQRAVDKKAIILEPALQSCHEIEPVQRRNGAEPGT